MSMWAYRLSALRGMRESAESDKTRTLYTDAMRTIACILIEGSY